MIAVLILLAVVAFLIWNHFNWKAQAWPEEGCRPSKYQGHRGYWKGGAQENTLASFKAAKERGLHMVEMDVRLSKDDVVVVFHDDTLERIGNSSKKVRELTAYELQALVNAPTLRDVLISNDVPEFLNIELKTAEKFDSTLENKIAELVRETGTSSRILFSSFNPLSIRRLSKVLPEIPRALLATKEEDPMNKFYLKHLWLAPFVRANALHLDHHFVSVEELRRYTKRGVPVAFWTVNEKEKADELLKNGALSIISDTLS
ncbi:MAG: glycerophosphodiester phosphodiesterase [Bdellovibrio sp.]|nr:glycerophosphodiester phosphodiesterase [Bdellovibrio sp.]